MYYFDNKKIKNIKSFGYGWNHKKFRFFLELELVNPQPKTAIVVMKNPAKACQHHLCMNRGINSSGDVESDATINRIIGKLESDYGRIIVLNLYPFMSSDPGMVQKIYSCSKSAPILKKAEATNRYFIFETLKRNEGADIFCAWGQQSKLSVQEYAKKIFGFIISCVRQHYSLGQFDKSTGRWEKLTTFFPTHGNKW